jgi:DNA-binding transcriptional LysR family regulator
VFEACARHLSFKMTANELNVTPGAVSRQIKAIEDELAVPLFARLAKGVALTSDGEELYAVLANGFARASEVVRSITRGDRTRNVTLACTDAFAAMWLLPRMPDFWRRFPEIAVDHLISDNAKDYRRAEVELRIRYGFGAWSDEAAELLFDDVIFPCAGRNSQPRMQFSQRGTSRHCRYSTSTGVDPEWAGWDEFLIRAGIPRSSGKGRRFGKFSVAIQAAMADQGVAIGWGRLAAEQMATGRLVRITDVVLQAAGAYYITWNANRALSPAASVLLDWIRAKASDEKKGAV